MPFSSKSPRCKLGMLSELVGEDELLAPTLPASINSGSKRETNSSGEVA